MSSDTDTDLSVERYDPEDNINAYGSPIYTPTEAAAGPSNVVLPARNEVSPFLRIFTLISWFLSNFIGNSPCQIYFL